VDNVSCDVHHLCLRTVKLSLMSPGVGQSRPAPELGRPAAESRLLSMSEISRALKLGRPAAESRLHLLQLRNAEIKKWRNAGGRRAELYGCALWSWGSELGTNVCEHEHVPPTPLPTWLEMSQGGVFDNDLDADSTSNGGDSDLFQYGIDSDSEHEHMPETILQNHRKDNSYEPELFSPKTPVSSDASRSSAKRRSPASKASRVQRLLAYQERLVKEKGLPKSRLQLELELEVTPASPTQLVPHSPKPALCRKNLSGEFQRIGAEARHQRQNQKDSSTDSHLEGGNGFPGDHLTDPNVWNVPSSGRQQEEWGERRWGGQGERTVVEGGDVSSFESHVPEAVTSNIKNNPMLCSERFGQDLGEQAPWMNWVTAPCSGCGGWGYIYLTPAVSVY